MVTFSFFFLASLPLFARVDLYQLNLKTGLCEPKNSEGSQRKAMSVEDFSEISQELIVKVPACKNQKTCLTPQYLEQLKTLEMLPDGPSTKNFLNSEFKDKAAKECGPYADFESAHQMQKIKMFLKRKDARPPLETKMSYEIVEKTKKVTDIIIENRKKSLESLRSCLLVDSILSKVTANQSEKLKIYKSSKDYPAGCESLWGEKSPINGFQDSLLQMRMAMIGLKLGASQFSRDPNQFKKMAEQLYTDKIINSDVNKVLSTPLVHNRGDVFNQMFNPFLQGAPQSIEAATSEEKKLFASYLKFVEERFEISNGRSPQTVDEWMQSFTKDYTDTVSHHPATLFIPQATPDSSELLKGFDLFKFQFDQHFNKPVDDLDLFKMAPKLFSAILADSKADEIGSMCVLIAYMTKSKQDYEEVWIDYLSTLMFLEAGVAAKGGKGLVGKLKNFAFSKSLAVTPLSYFLVENSWSDFSISAKGCSSAATNSQGLCDIASLYESNSNRNQIVGFVAYLNSSLAVQGLKKLRK